MGATLLPDPSAYEASFDRMIHPKSLQLFGITLTRAMCATLFIALQAHVRIPAACSSHTRTSLSIASSMDETDDVEEKKARRPEQEGERQNRDQHEPREVGALRLGGNPGAHEQVERKIMHPPGEQGPIIGEELAHLRETGKSAF